MFTLSVTLSFVTFMAETGDIARGSSRKGRGRLRDLFVIWSSYWWLEVKGREDE